MAQGTGQAELLEAVRAIQNAHPILSAAGLFLATPTRDDPLPAMVTSVHLPGRGVKSIGGSDRSRRITLLMKAVGAEQNGRSGYEIADELARANHELWSESIGGLSPQVRLNAVLHPLGWSADVPLEKGDVGPYKDTLDDLERWHVGHLWLFAISRLGAL